MEDVQKYQKFVQEVQSMNPEQIETVLGTLQGDNAQLMHFYFKISPLTEEEYVALLGKLGFNVELMKIPVGPGAEERAKFRALIETNLAYLREEAKKLVNDPIDFYPF